MSYPVAISFEGLCAVLPSEEIRADKPLDWVSILLVHTDEVAGYPPHEPILSFRLADLAGQNAGVHPEARVDWPLREVDVFLDYTSSDPVKVKAKFGKAQGERPNSNNSEEVGDLRWVPRLDEALPRREAIRRGLDVDGSNIAADCLAKTPIDDRVIARVHLRQGLLRVKDQVRINRQVSVSQFMPSEEAAPLRQAISAGIALDLNSVETPVGIRIRPFGGTSSTPIILGSAGRTERLRVAFSNLCSCADGFARIAESARDEDFELFYLLAGVGKDKLGGLPAPAPVRFAFINRGDGGTVFKRCTEAQLRPLSPAERQAYEANVINLA